MAQTLCQLKKKGGGELKETTLWTNSSPTSSFSTQNITVPDITPYKLIKVTFRASTSDSTEYYELYTSDQLLSVDYATSNKQIAILGFYLSTVGRLAKYVKAISTTSINFSNTINIGTGNNYNNYIIPIKITGLK